MIYRMNSNAMKKGKNLENIYRLAAVGPLCPRGHDFEDTCAPMLCYACAITSIPRSTDSKQTHYLWAENNTRHNTNCLGKTRRRFNSLTAPLHETFLDAHRGTFLARRA